MTPLGFQLRLYVPLTADELVILVKARDLLRAKATSGNLGSYRVEIAHSALLDVLRYAYLDMKDLP